MEGKREGTFKYYTPGSNSTSSPPPICVPESHSTHVKHTCIYKHQSGFTHFLILIIAIIYLYLSTCMQFRMDMHNNFIL